MTTNLADKSLDEIVIAARELDNYTLFNIAAQAWNHVFYWNSLSRDGGGRPHGAIERLQFADR